MKKKVFFLFVFFSLLSYGQLDREHWFAPMVNRLIDTDYTGYPPTFQSIYVSTGETTPFQVDIYYNNVVVASFMISKNNPQRYVIPETEKERIIKSTNWTTPADGLFQPIAMGFYLRGEKPFFASLRFSAFNHAEIQTSKGTAALGTEFRVVTAPIADGVGTNNLMSSVMATEDNTTVTVTEFDPDVVFMDEIPRTSFTFTLNKGQSYLIEASSVYYANWTGYIGAKITSDKPVVIANGNFNGQYAVNANGGSSDILMDQGVPVNKLGKTFVLVKGNGANGFTYFSTYTTMEKAIIVAVKDNTKIYLNGNTSPAATINAGEFFTTPPGSYIDQGSGHFNMYIESTEDVYVYQLLAGVDDEFSVASGGFNYIPPLSCYLPKKIDEIGRINENEHQSNAIPNGTLTTPTRLNVITEKGATIDVKRNGTSLPITSTNGPHNVTGNNNWVTYSFPDISGNVSITSTHAVTAGITAGNNAVGYGGFFAGFASIPMIVKIEGECLPDDVKLGVIEGFDHYQWLQKVGNTYINAPVTAQHPSNTDYFYYPSQAGIYAVRIQTGSCASVQTEDYKFFNCTNYTNINYSICSDLQITPNFALSTQLLNPTTVTVTEPPTKGTVTIAPDGTLAYHANNNETGIDKFKFSFCGIGAITDCEVIQATIQINQVVKHDVDLHSCSATNTAVFNLNQAAVTPDLTAQKKYYRDAALTDQIPNTLVTNFSGNEGDVIYAAIKNSFNCEAVAAITLKIDKPAVVNENLYTRTHCDEDIDGIIDTVYKVNVRTITPIVVPNSAGYTILYYETEAKANAGGTDNITGVYSFTESRPEIWIRVDPNNSCPAVIKKILLRIGTKVSINATVSYFACDNDLDDQVDITLSDYVQLFTSDTNVTVKYFDDLLKAQNNIAGEDLSVNQTISGDKTYYYRFKKSGFCDTIGILNLDFRQPRVSEVLDDVPICPEATTTLDAGVGFDGYEWSTGETSQTIHNVPVGDYWVKLSSNGCVYQQYVSVKAVELPEIVRIDILGSTVTVHVSGGNPPYQYALDNLNYQNSNVFYNVSGGDHIVYVISSDDCLPVSVEINVIEPYNVITPNGDGVNDVLNFFGLMKKQESSLQIFDRYGTLIFTGTKNNLFSWDGKISGRAVNTGSYWMVVRWKEPGHNVFSQHQGWVLVKNRN